ncbi:hypothetical protein V3C99_000546, partial [Haemonchus contortus]
MIKIQYNERENHGEKLKPTETRLFLHRIPRTINL